jgi:eukaryotic-like serine/threonine-protein kinase
MATPRSCPDRQQFLDALGGSAPPEAVEALASHLESCKGCAQQFDRAVEGDTLLEAMRQQSTVDTELEPEAAAVVERLLRLRLGAANLSEPDPSSAYEPAGGTGEAADDERWQFLEPPAQADEIGRLGPYRILRILGAGGMGVVFQAEDSNLRRLVALKVLTPKAAEKPGARERFLREARALARLEHENVVTVHHVGEANGVAYIGMQWLKGHSLDDRLRNPEPIAIRETLRIGRQVALGLAAAHEHGLIHRDVKPANIWIEAAHGGRIKLLDFGLARPMVDAEQLTRSGSIIGTPAYMAPEQANGEKIDHRCDLFSLGVVLYRLTTGQFPFSGKSPVATLIAVAVKSPAPPESLAIDLPAGLSDLIVQLLVKEPAQRPASANEVAERLLAIKLIFDSSEP